MHIPYQQWVISNPVLSLIDTCQIFSKRLQYIIFMNWLLATMLITDMPTMSLKQQAGWPWIVIQCWSFCLCRHWPCWLCDNPALCVAVIFFWITLKSNILSTILFNTCVQTVLFVTIIQTCKLCTILKRLSPGKIWSNYFTIRKQCCSLSSLTKPVFWLSTTPPLWLVVSDLILDLHLCQGQDQVRWQYLKVALR